MEDFVSTSTEQYHLDLVRYGLPMRRALEAYLLDRPSVRAIFMGTRRTDPHSEFLAHFSPTDADWPQFMRVNPLIDWHYAEIWAVCIPPLINDGGTVANMHASSSASSTSRSAAFTSRGSPPSAA